MYVSRGAERGLTSGARGEESTELRMRQAMLDASADCIELLTPDGVVEHMNRVGCLALGVPLDSNFGMPWLDLLPQEVRARGRRALARARQGKVARFAGRSELPGGGVEHWDNLLTPMTDEDGQVVSILCLSRNVTAQLQAERRLRAASELDALTGLPNRRSFNRALRREISRARAAREGVLALFLGDLDHFKAVNDTLGHSAGDHLLKVVSRRLRTTVGDRGFVARLGGDEFAILAPVADEDEVREIGEQVLEGVRGQVTFHGTTINPGLSLGCAVYPCHAADPSTLMRSADTALHELKDVGRGGLCLFDAEMLGKARRRASELEHAHRVVQRGLVEVFLQPRVRLADGEVMGYEALLRWRDEDGALRGPADVAEAFQDYTLATGLAEQVRRQVLVGLRRGLDAGTRPLPVSLNVSPVEFLRGDFAQRLLADLEEHGVPSELLELEVAERVLTDRGAPLVERALAQLSEAGVRIALDDFGTGASAFGHLRRNGISALKIDRHLVQEMPHDAGAMTIVRTVVGVGTSLGLEVVAEGVETSEQRLALVAAGCGFAQGFLFGHPAPAPTFWP